MLARPMRIASRPPPAAATPRRPLVQPPPPPPADVSVLTRAGYEYIVLASAAESARVLGLDKALAACEVGRQRVRARSRDALGRGLRRAW